MLSVETDLQTPPIRPLSPQKRRRIALYTCHFRLIRHSDFFVPLYGTYVGTPSPSGLTVAPGLTIPWPHPNYRLYGEYLTASGLSPRPPRRHPKAYDPLYLWYEPHLFTWNSWLQMVWQARETWSAYTDPALRTAHLCFRTHGYHDGLGWAPNPGDPIWTPENTPRVIVDFWLDGARVFDSFNGVDSIPVGEWIATWGPKVSAIFQPRQDLSPLRRIMLLTAMLLATGLITLEYTDRDFAETELARQYAITEESKKWR